MYWSTSLTLAAKFADLMGGVCRALSQQGPRRRSPAPVVELVMLRLHRMWTRLTGLAEKLRAGTLPARTAPRPRLPTPSPGWLIQMVPETHLINAWRYPLEELLADPETVALVAASAQAGRLLRPLCSMLMVEPPAYLRLPPRPRRPKVVRVLTPAQRDAKLAKMGRLAYAQVINPEIDGKPNGCRPPNKIGYGRPKRLIKRDPY